jgi:hypothetical protein
MSTKKQNKQAADIYMMRSVYDTVADLEDDYDVEIRIAMWPSERRGAFWLQLMAISTYPHTAGTTLESTSIEYPNASTLSFEAQLFRQVNVLAQLLASRPIPSRPT